MKEQEYVDAIIAASKLGISGKGLLALINSLDSRVNRHGVLLISKGDAIFEIDTDHVNTLYIVGLECERHAGQIQNEFLFDAAFSRFIIAPNAATAIKRYEMDIAKHLKDDLGYEPKPWLQAGVVAHEIEAIGKYKVLMVDTTVVLTRTLERVLHKST